MCYHCVVSMVSSQTNKQHRPYGGISRDLGKTDGHSATLFHIVRVSSWFHLQQVWSSSDGHLLLEATGAVSPAHQHKGILRIWLQLCDQLPLQVALNLHTLLVVEDLKTG